MVLSIQIIGAILVTYIPYGCSCYTGWNSILRKFLELNHAKNGSMFCSGLYSKTTPKLAQHRRHLPSLWNHVCIPRSIPSHLRFLWNITRECRTRPPRTTTEATPGHLKRLMSIRREHLSGPPGTTTETTTETADPLDDLHHGRFHGGIRRHPGARRQSHVGASRSDSTAEAL